MTKTRIFKIYGMRCTACSGNVEKRLKKLDAVESAEVNFSTAECFVSADEKKVPDELIISTVAKLGFKAEAVKDGAPDVDETDDTSKEKRDFIFAAVSSCALMAVSMTHFFDGAVNTVMQVILTAVVILSGRKFFLRGIPALLNGAPDMDTLIACGSGASVIYSIFLIAVGNTGHLYFDSAAMIITFVMGGKYLEAKVRSNTIDSIRSLTQMIPEKVSLVSNGVIKEVPAETVRAGDILQVVNGNRVPADGYVVENSGWVDESMFTGESVSVEKKCSDRVTGGTFCTGGTFKMAVTSTGNDTLLANIIKMVKQAQGTKAPVARIADKVSGYFACFVLAVSAITFLAHFLTGASVGTALNFSLAAMVISCPCALGLATPVALVAGIGRGAKSGILIKSASVLELVCKVRCVAFDKTGTLTSGEAQYKKMFLFDGFNENELLANMVSAEAGIGHPLASAAAKEAEKRGIECVAEVKELNHFPGRGLSCSIGKKSWLFGSADFLAENKVDISNFPDAGKYSTICIACDLKLAGVAAFGTELRKNSVSAIEKLHAMGIKSVILSGDRKAAVSDVAEQLNTDSFYAELLPQDKLEMVSNLKENGILAMVGDGVNDAPALAKADVGIAPGCGNPSAHDAAGIVIVGDDVLLVPQAISLGRATRRVIKQHRFWAFFYNRLAIPLASGAFYALFGGPVLSPAVCAGAMAASSLTVVFNAARLKGAKL